MSKPQRAITYYLKSIEIDSPRFEKDGGAIDITSICSEINLYESITSPYITGSLMMTDTSGVSNQIKASGQETVTIDLYVDEDFPIKREFIIYSVKKQVKQQNSGSSIYVYSLIEKHGFFSYFQRINRGYTGNISDIIFGIYQQELYGAKTSDTDSPAEEDIEKTILNADNFERPVQTVKIVSPNRTPLSLCMWLAKRATSDYGEPFFLYSSLREGPQFRSLGSLLQGGLSNPEKPYRYSQVYTGVDLADEIYRIYELSIPENDNTIALAKGGAFGIQYQSIDPFYKSNDAFVTEAHFDQDEHFRRKMEAGRTLEEFNLYDKQFRIGPNSTVQEDGEILEGKSLTELNSQIHSEINTSNSFEDFNSFDEESDIGKHLFKVSRQSDMAFMNKQKMHITIPGYNMLKDDTNSSIGKIIDIRIPSDITHSQTPDDEDLYDRKKTGSSGKGGLYLTTRARHRFNIPDSNYMASLEVAKMTSPEEL